MATSPFDRQHAGTVSRIQYYANRYGIPANIAVWQIWQESKFNPRAVSSAGAKGIAQFMPATAQRFGVVVYDVESSLNGWGKYMSAMLGMFNGRLDIALAGYNSGENRSEYRKAASEGRPINWAVMPAGVRSETQAYVNTIMRNAGMPIGALAGGSVADSGGLSGISTAAIAAGVLIFVLLATE